MAGIKVNEIKWGKDNLVPAIVQDYLSGKVLMVGYMNKESLQRTLETGETWFWSRSREVLWHKGATSGNTQKLVNISLDCDLDTILMEVIPQGPACHLGTESCFKEGSNLFLDDLRKIIKKRYQERPEGSYTSYLFDKGLDKILKKVGEEGAEVIIAAKNPDKKELVYEAADLLFHLLVLFEERQIDFRQILHELKERRS
jgi:phosphoribosyl-ATP pyrophosphohydrolase/phosphoribosyl-AMP cyclohydrolase